VLPIVGRGQDSAGRSVDIDALFERWNVSAAQTNPGMPLHVTLMAPFIDSAGLDDSVIERLQRVIAGRHPFVCSLAEVRTFEGEPTRAWLAPQPESVFVDMTRAIMEAFPGLVPYGGEHPEIRPHVSVAKGSSFDLQKTIAEISNLLPISVMIDSYAIYTLDGRRWNLTGSHPI